MKSLSTLIRRRDSLMAEPTGPTAPTPAAPKAPASARLVTGIAYHTARRYDRAVEALEAARDALPTSHTVNEFLAAAYAHLGRLDLAKIETRRLLRLFPAASLAYYPHTSACGCGVAGW